MDGICAVVVCRMKWMVCISVQDGVREGRVWCEEEGVCVLPYHHDHGPSTAGICHLNMLWLGLWWLVAVASEGFSNVFA